MPHTICDIRLSKHSNGSDNLCYTADGHDYEVDGEFYIDSSHNLHHTHVFDDNTEQDIIIPYENGEY